MNKMSIVISATGLALLTGCVSSSLPTTGTPSKFDGKWAGALPSTRTGCENVTFDGEVRFGHSSGDLFQHGSKIGVLSGKIVSDNTMEASISLAGGSAGSSTISFTDTQASGSWFSAQCSGDVNIKKVS